MPLFNQSVMDCQEYLLDILISKLIRFCPAYLAFQLPFTKEWYGHKNGANQSDDVLAISQN